MAIRCPECGNLISSDGYCGTDGCLTPTDGVWRVMSLDFYRRLKNYLDGFERMREEEGFRIKETILYPTMPFGSNYPRAFGDTFNELARDLRWISKRLPKAPGKVLNYGAWNGWLSYQLTRRQHDVIAVSYFIDPFDGLAAKKHFSTDWTAIQMDIERLDIVEEHFDVIIMNRGISYLSEPLRIVAKLIEKLATSGVLLITGLHIFWNPQVRQKTLADRAKHYHRRYGIELFPRHTKGYLDRADLEGLKSMGISLDPCRYGFSNVIPIFQPSRPRCYRGWYLKEVI